MSAHDRVAAIEDALVRLLFDGTERERFGQYASHVDDPQIDRDLRNPRRADLDALGTEVVKRLVQRPNRGVGTLGTAFPEVFAAWAERYPDDAKGSRLIARFAASGTAMSWRPIHHVGLGRPLEGAFARFVVPLGLVPAETVERRMLLAVGRALVVDPNPGFLVPDAFVGRPGHWVALQAGSEPFLVAAIGGQLTSGPITGLVADIIRGRSNEDVSGEHGVDVTAVERTRVAILARGLLAA